MTDGFGVEHFVPVLLPADAVSRYTVEARRACRDAGHDGGIWCVSVHPDLEGAGRDYRHFPEAGQATPRLLLYQVAGGSFGIVDFLLGRPEPLLVCHHNLTPPEFYDPYDPPAAAQVRLAQAELRRLCARLRVAVADSEVNAGELRRLGVGDVRVVPPYLGEGAQTQPHAELLRRLRATKYGTDLLFVGRLVPNKGHLHLIRLLAVLRDAIDPEARLFLVGPPGPEAYMRLLHATADRLCPGGVVFTGAASAAELAAHYAAADLFVSMSEHEGFGIPLVEAMRADLPVIALAAAAVPETLGGAGILLSSPDPLVAAECAATLAGDEDLRARVLAGQAERVRELEAFPRDREIVLAAEAAVA